MNDPKAFIEYSNYMQHVYKNIDGYNPSRQCNVLIVFDDIVADMISNKTLKLKLNISLVFIIQSYFAVLQNIRLNSTHCFIMKIQNKQQLQQIAINHSSDTDFKDFVDIYSKCTENPYLFWWLIVLSL